MEVASPEGWRRDPELVLDFYNQRRRDLHQATPNAADLALARASKSLTYTLLPRTSTTSMNVQAVPRCCTFTAS